MGEDKDKKESVNNKPSSSPILVTTDAEDDSPEKDDYEYFIKELQKIIDESPSGMQASFARAIAQLKQSAHQNIIVKKFIAESKEKKLSREQIRRKIMELLSEDLDDDTPEPASKKFRKMLQVARLREELSSDAKKNN